MSGPLQGIRVIDLTTVGMGPYATETLGDMGADVIKVESPAGDHFRHVPPYRNVGMGATFLNLNRNKRSIVLDLKNRDDLHTLIRLVADADVFISNVRPQAIRKLGLDYESLASLNPRLIYAGLYGFSEQGPYAGRPAYDDVIQALSGLAFVQGVNSEHGPQYVNSVVADKTVGLFAVYAIAMALYERERSGLGQAVEVPMFETMTAFNLIEHLAGQTFRDSSHPMGYERVLSEYRRPYRTTDGYIGLTPYTDMHWRQLYALLGHPDWTTDTRFISAEGRATHIHELYAHLAAAVAARSTREWVELLEASDIPWTRIASLDDLLDDPHLAATGFFQDLEHPSEGAIRATAIPVRFSRTPGSIQRPAPRLGQHTAEIREELAARRQRKPVATPPS